MDYKREQQTNIWLKPLSEVEGFTLNEKEFEKRYESFKPNKEDLCEFMKALDLCSAAIAIHAFNESDVAIHDIISNFISDFDPYRHSDDFDPSILYFIHDNRMGTILSLIDEIKEEEADVLIKNEPVTSFIWGKLSGEFLFNNNVRDLKLDMEK